MTLPMVKLLSLLVPRSCSHIACSRTSGARVNLESRTVLFDDTVLSASAPSKYWHHQPREISSCLLVFPAKSHKRRTNSLQRAQKPSFRTFPSPDCQFAPFTLTSPASLPLASGAPLGRCLFHNSDLPGLRVFRLVGDPFSSLYPAFLLLLGTSSP